MKFIFLILTSFQSLAQDSTILNQKSFGDYTVVIMRDEELDGQRFIIKKQGKIVHNEGEPGSYYWIGNHYDDTIKGDPYSGTDLTGDDIPELVISQWNGGAHCCHFLRIFELNKSALKKLAHIDGGSYGFEIRDLDKDNIPEITFWNWPIDYIFNSFSHSAQGKTILRVVQNHYHASAKLMYRKRPNDKKLRLIKNKIKKDFIIEEGSVPFPLLKIMMDLSYTGYKELALRIAQETWPTNRNDFKDFKIKFTEALNDSPYWREFNQGKY